MDAEITFYPSGQEIDLMIEMEPSALELRNQLIAETARTELDPLLCACGYRNGNPACTERSTQEDMLCDDCRNEGHGTEESRYVNLATLRSQGAE